MTTTTPAGTHTQTDVITAAHADAVARFKQRLVGRAARECAERGWTRIALYGAGRHTRVFIRQPWAWHGVRVIAVLDDAPAVDRIGGVPVVRPADLSERPDAVVVSSDSYEGAIAARAAEHFGPLGVPVVRVYGDEPCWEPDEQALRRVSALGTISDADAQWLVANRTERHDATLPVLPPARTELHIRRYELAAGFARGMRVLDAACGTGYGSALLREQGSAASVLGVDIDPETIAYATRRFARPGVRFAERSATATGLPDASVDLITSFETIEHVPDPAALLAEFSRVLAPAGRLVISTPNDWGLTAFHAHSFTPSEFRTMIERAFRPVQWLGQRASDTPACDTLPPGMFPMDTPGWEPETLLVIAAHR